MAIPMRDGVRLIADRYVPETPPPFPVILIRTPYGRGMPNGAFGLITEFCARRFAEQGYAVVVQDVRGRFDSGSAFEPFRFEREDGWDTLTWLSDRDWCGPIGMWGSSYLGIVQWAAADHPAVRALMPMITASDVYAVAFHDGLLNLDLGARWIAILNLQEQYKRRPLLSTAALATGVERSARRAFRHLPLYEADAELPKGTVRYFRSWMNEHLNGEDLRRYFPTAAPGSVTAPVLLVGGWYDFFLRGLLNDYAALQAAGHSPRMVIGNWVHFSYAFLMLNSLGMAVRWFDETLRGSGMENERSADGRAVARPYTPDVGTTQGAPVTLGTPITHASGLPLLPMENRPFACSCWATAAGRNTTTFHRPIGCEAGIWTAAAGWTMSMARRRPRPSSTTRPLRRRSSGERSSRSVPGRAPIAGWSAVRTC
ncbi:MAG: CocE/NonD family hydrolase [Chloroflexi bacterium]|nr:CocE/NonD family hydrolase [Chloroflexota bacterium]